MDLKFKMPVYCTPSCCPLTKLSLCHTCQQVQAISRSQHPNLALEMGHVALGKGHERCSVRPIDQLTQLEVHLLTAHSRPTTRLCLDFRSR